MTKAAYNEIAAEAAAKFNTVVDVGHLLQKGLLNTRVDLTGEEFTGGQNVGNSKESVRHK